ncbi:hypothetical protein ACIA5G_39735 [Amycolatopsis sp. NPDC051758]|uniref:hypothetical protein n=1 Tax=Amycolatopsis sp. NPDC051758 TaxID=3363935 RepID=UPI003794150A
MQTLVETGGVVLAVVLAAPLDPDRQAPRLVDAAAEQEVEATVSPCRCCGIRKRRTL